MSDTDGSGAAAKAPELRLPWVFAVLAMSLLAGLAVWSISAFVVLTSDYPPEGSTCDYELDNGSGPAGSGGHEEIRWGYFPQRVCIVQLPNRVHEDYLGGDYLTPLAVPVVVLTGWFVGRWAVARWIPSSVA